MSLKVMVVDPGTRGHALAWKLAQSPRVGKVYCAPGNSSTVEIAENTAIQPVSVPWLAQFVEDNGIDLTVVGTEDAIDARIADEFSSRGLRIWAPLAWAGRLETSKIFMKQLLTRIGVPTAPFEVFLDYHKAMAFVSAHGCPLVIKVDGLAHGKGVYVCHRWIEADEALHQLLMQKKMPSATRLGVVIEDFIPGEEVSAHAFCSGRRTLHLPLSCDYKPLYNGNKGPNTGGMGGYSPVDWVSEATEERIRREIIDSIAYTMDEERHFMGMMYPGIMLTPDPMVLEVNARPGDPEFQILLRRLSSDIVEPIEACIEGTLDTCALEWSPQYAVAVSLVGSGYPGNDMSLVKRIHGFEDARRIRGVEIFHAGTTLIDGTLCTRGNSRVLSITALADTLDEACGLAYEAVHCITYEGMSYRTDIGRRMRME